MTFHLKKMFSSALVVAALATTGSIAPSQAAPVTPAQWLQSQSKPVFKPGHTLPRLTRYGWSLALGTNAELTENWHYALQLPIYLNDESLPRFDDPNDEVSKIVALTNSNPAKYPLAAILSRSDPASPEPLTFLRDGAGNLLDGRETYSPLNPQSVIDQMAELRARPLRNLRARVPISMILNGGEYGLGVIGDDNIFQRDPAVVAAYNQSGDDWFNFISKAKAQEMNTIAAAVRTAVPDRSLYIYYHSGNVERNRYYGWKNWTYDNSYALNSSDLPSNELYYKHYNTGYLNDGDNNDMLTRALNASGFQIANGKKLSYDWLSNGWINESGGAAPPPVYNPAALIDPNAGQLGSNNIYTGLLKCLFTAGMIGGNAGYYAFPAGGFDGSFEPDRPKYYLPQMTALSHIQALFSYLESDVRNSDLLAGPNMHVKSTGQPAYELPTGSPGSRALARKVSGQDKWIITAWAADGVDRTVNVTIPTLGSLALSARTAGSVYIATIVNNQVQLMLTDSNAMTPTVGGYAPVNVTPTPTSNPNPAFANGGFETPVLSGGSGAYAYNPTGAGWISNYHSGIQRNGSAWNGTNAPEGSQTAFLQGDPSGPGSVSQAVNFDVGTYKIQFQAARRGGILQPVQVKVDGVNLGSPITPSSDSFALYTSAAFTVFSGNHEITVASTDPGDKTSFVDDVRIVVVASAVPSVTGVKKIVGKSSNTQLWQAGEQYLSYSGTFYTCAVPTSWVADNGLWKIVDKGDGYYQIANKTNGNILWRAGEQYLTYGGTYNLIDVPSTWIGDAGLWQLQDSAVTVSASTPAMEVHGSGTLADGSGLYDYGTVNVNTPLDHSFTVDNKGSGTLTLTGSPRAVMSGTNAADFTVTVQPAATVAAAGSATFTVRFTPSAAGTRTATILIASNDAATSPYTFNVTGSGLSVPLAPSTLAATRPANRQINLTWKDNSGNESGFKIERATNSTFTTNLVQVATTAANVVTYSNTGLAANTRYYYRIRATNAAGNSAFSNVVNALTGA